MAGTEVVELRTEGKENPLGLDVPSPRLSWRIASPDRGWVQTAYRIQVHLEDLILWDSDRVASSQSIEIPYEGPALRSGRRYTWRVQAWNRDGAPSDWSNPAWWEMGLLDGFSPDARWIGRVRSHPAWPDIEDAARIWTTHDAPPGGQLCFLCPFTIAAGRRIVDATVLLSATEPLSITLNRSSWSHPPGENGPLVADLRSAVRVGENYLTVSTQQPLEGPAGLVGALRVCFEAHEPMRVPTGDGWMAAAVSDGGTPPPGDAAWLPASARVRYGEPPFGRDPLVQLPSPHLRTTFTIDRPVTRARIYATALGLYELALNGSPVAADRFAPGWTDYHKRVQYQTYDVTALLRPGHNALGALLGDGWYTGSLAIYGDHHYGLDPALLLQLEVEYEDGERLQVVSSPDWKAGFGQVLSSSIYFGETQDGRLAAGWSDPGFDDSSWPVADIFGPFEAELCAQVDPPIRTIERRRAVDLWRTERGSTIFDLGQNMVGWARIRANGPPGTRLLLQHAEALNDDRTMYTANLRDAFQVDEYILSGGEETFEPHFTYHGFRYVELYGYPGVPSLDDLEGCVVHSSLPFTGTFSCSSEMLNQLQSNIVWSARDNFFSVPTDCPQRNERLGWGGDAGLFSGTAAFIMDVQSFFAKWMRDFRDAQLPDGAYRVIAPHIGRLGAGVAVWSDAGVVIPWTVYRAYGDRHILAECYDSMVRWIGYLEAHSDGLIRPAEGYGDWLPVHLPAHEDTPREVVSTAYFAYVTRLMREIAGVLGRGEDAKRFDALHGDIKAAFIREYVGGNGAVQGDTQATYVLALAFDLLPEEIREATLDRLVDDIRSRNWHLRTGIVGTRWLLSVLADAGREDAAFRLLMQESFPSWGNMIAHGATTIWEWWDGYSDATGHMWLNSYNHYAFGSVGQFLYEYVAGITPQEPGYRRIRIRPHIGGELTQAGAALDSVYGRIVSRWEVDESFRLHVEIPPNTTASVIIPAGRAEDVREGGQPILDRAHMRLEGEQQGSITIEIGSGSYDFTAPR